MQIGSVWDFGVREDKFWKKNYYADKVIVDRRVKTCRDGLTKLGGASPACISGRSRRIWDAANALGVERRKVNVGKNEQGTWVRAPHQFVCVRAD